MTSRVGSLASTSPTRSERVELILSQLNRLPTLPVVAARLLEVTTASDSCAQDVVRIVESDASLTGAILRMVRRADLGLRDEVITVDRAVVLLGFSTIRNAVLSLQLYETFSPGGGDTGVFMRGAFWKHTLAVACAAQLIAEAGKGVEDAGEAFVCGLLHDIGKIALNAAVPKAYTRVLQKVDRVHACVCDAERELLGFDHTVAGKRLLTHWKLPQAIVECAWLHHQSPDALPSCVAHKQLVCIVRLADDLVRRQRIGFSGYQHVGPVEEYASALGISPDRLGRIVEQIPERMEPFTELIGTDDEEEPTVSTSALVEANKELGRANALLTHRQRLLEVRSVCFDALGRFTQKLIGRDTVSGICTAAAETLGNMLACDRAAAFLLLPAMRCIQVATVGADKDATVTSIIDLGSDRTGDELDDLASLPVSRGIGVAPRACRAIWRHCFENCPPKLWMLPIIESDNCVGGVLFSAADEDVERFLRAKAECEVLSRAMGLAASWASARTESERMNEELLDLNRRLSEAQAGLVRARSISMVAQMAAGAAHELNNPLAVIAGRAQMLRNKIPDEDTVRALDVINLQAVRASQIVMELMEFAKPPPPEPTTQNLGQILERLCQHWKEASSLEEGRVSVTIPNHGLTVFADPTQLDQILGAVMSNAVEAMEPESARLHINSPSSASDEKVRIVVEDNGVGMTPEVLEHALDPFFSSRPAGRGRGLGLSRAYRLAEMNGGRLWLESTPGVSTRVTIELPARQPSD